MKCESDAGVALQVAGSGDRVGLGVPGQASSQGREEFAEVGGGGVAGGAPGGLVGAGPAVAQAAGVELGELGRVGETASEGVLGGVLMAGIAGGDRSELERAGDPCRAVAVA